MAFQGSGIHVVEVEVEVDIGQGVDGVVEMYGIS
jgi:hypothetical protein